MLIQIESHYIHLNVSLKKTDKHLASLCFLFLPFKLEVDLTARNESVTFVLYCLGFGWQRPARRRRGAIPFGVGQGDTLHFVLRP